TFKVNLYLLYNEVSIASARNPLLAHPDDVLSADDLRAVTAFAHRQHVALVLEQQSLGHMREVLRHERYRDLAMRPGSATVTPGAASDAFLDSLYADIVPLFDGPFVQGGGAEPGELAEPGRAAAAEAQFVRHIAHRARAIARYERRVMLWSDYALAHPAVIRQLPAGSVIAVWDFTV